MCLQIAGREAIAQQQGRMPPQVASLCQPNQPADDGPHVIIGMAPGADQPEPADQRRSVRGHLHGDGRAHGHTDHEGGPRV
jgi:hypothetical protein